MEPLAIVEPFDKRKDLSARLLPCVIRLVMDQLILERAEETLRHRVVIAVALPAHARNHAEPHGLPLIGQAAILRPLIGVMNQAGPDAALADRHRQGIQRQLLIGPGTHGPADRSAPIQIQEHRDIEPARSCWHMGHVPDPHAIESRRDKGEDKGSGVFS